MADFGILSVRPNDIATYAVIAFEDANSHQDIWCGTAIADTLREELMPPAQDNLPCEQPFYKLPGTVNTTKILDEYI